MKANTDMSFLMHLEELRRRLLRAGLAYLVAFGVCAYFSKELFTWLQMPLLTSLPHGSSFIATNALSGWRVIIQLALTSALGLLIPYLIFELWTFSIPGLKPAERRAIFPLIFLMLIFFAGGVIFSYRLVLPIALGFLIQIYDGMPVTFLPQIEDYFSFVIKTLIGFGILFELPFLVLFLTQARIVSAASMVRARPYVYVLAFVIGAVLTPPDVVSQVLMAVPFILLFEIGLVFTRIIKKAEKTSAI